ncbi:Protein of unknown function (DUF664) [Desulfosporosinus orientis DSM 765]|uniref:Putative metal-dependent hydrolase Desor_0498 n=1 Tax=Desulfosporosinus orientis (strain ATCC 19365 / DSM 765 / NCIMB 8382 / VKM B-1628 / Singapore I) TaxID=768706 RepID=G7WA62_DESOD|nr:putative metal-dependent hydrolase [Desulfosporosinus orientis]AET66200.1 Protein of unknown function (DUF664) [Desulfosporosinus orientis DSM 765]
MDDLKYPIGQYNFSKEVIDEQIPGLVSQIEVLPDLLSRSIGGLSEEQLNCSYRPEGWTIRQVVHHIADSHMNGYVRFRLALTEDRPTIKPYDEVQWAELEDAVNMPVDVSLRLIESLHKRWVRLIRSLSSTQLDSEFRHPDIGNVSIKKAISLYAWHGNHHLGHINTFKKKIGLEI